MPRPAVKDERREQILEGLFEAMAREGSIGASITDIAKAAGIARGALHYYFSSKDEIRRSLMAHLGHEYSSSLERSLDKAEARAAESGDGEALLSALVRWHFAGDEDRSSRLLAVWIDFWGQAPTDEGLNGVVLDVQERARKLCERALLFARPDLTRVAGVERRHLAAVLLALVEGGLLQWRVAAGSSAALDRAALAERILDAARAYVRSIPAPVEAP